MATLTRSRQNFNGGINLGVASANGVLVASSDQVENIDGKTWLYVFNGGASVDNVTIAVQNASQVTSTGAPVTVASATYAIAAGEIRLLGPFTPGIYNDANGFLQITHSFITSVRCLAVAFPI